MKNAILSPAILLVLALAVSGCIVALDIQIHGDNTLWTWFLAVPVFLVFVGAAAYQYARTR